MGQPGHIHWRRHGGCRQMLSIPIHARLRGGACSRYCGSSLRSGVLFSPLHAVAARRGVTRQGVLAGGGGAAGVLGPGGAPSWSPATWASSASPRRCAVSCRSSARACGGGPLLTLARNPSDSSGEYVLTSQSHTVSLRSWGVAHVQLPGSETGAAVPRQGDWGGARGRVEGGGGGCLGCLSVPQS